MAAVRRRRRRGLPAALAASRRTYLARRRQIGAPLAGFVVALAATAAGLAGLALAGVSPTAVATASVVLAVVAVLYGAILTTLLHEVHTGRRPRSLSRPLRIRGRLRRTRPAVAVGLALAVTVPSVLSPVGGAASAAEPAPSVVVVDSLADDPTADHDAECVDGSPCTLRGAVTRAAAQPGTRVTFAISGTIALGDVIVVDEPVVIDGAGRRGTLRAPTPDTALSPVALAVYNDDAEPVILRHLTIVGADADTSRGLTVGGSGPVVVDSVTFSGLRTSTTRGSAISTSGHLTVRNATFDRNSGYIGAGTVYNQGRLEILNSTFRHNETTGIVNGAGAAVVANSIFLTTAMAAWSCEGSVEAHANLSSDGTCVTHGDGRGSLGAHELGLGALGDHGGPVDTVPLLAGSMAIGGGDPAYCPEADARGERRPIPPTPCDVGAYQTTPGTTTFIEVTPDPVPYGRHAQVTVTVRHPVLTPTGQVELTGAGTTRTADLRDGVATFALTGLDVGDHTLEARYLPDGDLAASSRTHELSVVKVRTSTTMRVEPAGGSSGLGEPVDLHAIVATPDDPDGLAPQGEVEFRSGKEVVATATLEEGRALVDGVLLPAGAHALTAHYLGSPHFAASASPAVSQVVRSGTTVALDAPATTVFGNPAELSVTVDAVEGAATPTGQVLVRSTVGSHTFTVGSGGLVDGVLDLRVSEPLAAGDHTLVAQYWGDDLHEEATSAAVVLTVLPAATSTTLTGPGTATRWGQAATFTAEVEATDSPVTPQGRVSFRVAGHEAGVADLVDGVAVWEADDLDVSPHLPHVVTAHYLPEPADWTAGESNPVTHRIDQGETTTELLVGADTSPASTEVELTAVVRPVAPSTAHPRGQVVFRSGGDVVATADLDEGRATVAVDDLAVGTHLLTAEFLTTPDMRGSASAPVGHRVTKAGVEVELATSASDLVHGQSLDLTATLTTGSSRPVTGTVTFHDSHTALGSAPVVDGAATLVVPVLDAGTRALSARYHGDAVFAPAEGGLQLDVATARPEVRIVGVSPSPSRFGDPIVVTVEVTSPTGSAPAGEVEVRFSGSGVVGRGPVEDGVARVVAQGTSLARTTLSASYLGDENHDVAHTPTTPHELTWHGVGRTQPRLSVTTDPNPTVWGTDVEVTVRAEPVGRQVPSGLVRVAMFGVQEWTYLDPAGEARVVFRGMPPGELGVFVSVEGDRYFEAVHDQRHHHRVEPGEATVTLSTEPQHPVHGQDVELVAAVSPASAAGVGHVEFYSDGQPLGRGDVAQDGTARLTTRFTTPGTRHLTADYFGHGYMRDGRAEPVELVVGGWPVQLSTSGAAGVYGEDLAMQVVVSRPGVGGPYPTGGIALLLDGAEIGYASLGAPILAGGRTSYVVDVPLRHRVDPGSHRVHVRYGGDAHHLPVTSAATVVVHKAAVEVGLEAPADAMAGRPVTLGALLTRPPVGAMSPSGTLTLGSGTDTCEVHLSGGPTGGSCDVAFSSAGTLDVWARYSGDARYLPATSRTMRIEVAASDVCLTVDAPTVPVPRGSGWTDAAPVPVTWDVTGGGEPAPSGRVQVWTHEGRQSCPEDLAGECAVGFERPTDRGWIEVRYSGDAAYEATSHRVSGRVVGCFEVTLATGSVVSASNCGAGRFLGGTPVEVEAPERDGFRLAGWTTRAGDRHYTSPLIVTGDLFLTPRYEPVCVTLEVVTDPHTLRRALPDPLPNCHDPQEHGNAHDPLAEVASGAMRYLTGTEVTLRPYTVTAGDIRGTVTHRGEGLTQAHRMLLDRSRRVFAELTFECYSFEVHGPPGSQTGVSASRLDTAVSPLLDGYGDGACELPDGGTGYLPGTEIVVVMTPPAGAWFDSWGEVQPLAEHEPPAEVLVVEERPQGAVVGARATRTVQMPRHDAAISGDAAHVVCHPLSIELLDAVAPRLLTGGSAEPSVEATEANCPSWWLRESDALGDGHRWYLDGTAVTVEADASPREGYVQEYLDPQPIVFKGWSGDITGGEAVQEVTMTGPVEATAEWYVEATCSRLLVRAVPARGGEVTVGGLGDDCSGVRSTTGGDPVPRAPLGAEVVLAARPVGTLQPIWAFEGASVSETQACLDHEALIAEMYEQGYARGMSAAEIERDLMRSGYLPGWTMLRIEEEAERLFLAGHSQETVLDELTRMGLLTSGGTPAPDRQRDNPCERVSVDAVLPAGERVIPWVVDGDLVATAHMCQEIDRSATVVDVDGQARPAGFFEMATFAEAFTGRGGCPIPGWFHPGTATLGGGGISAPGYEIDGWVVDGVAHPAGPLGLSIDSERSPRVELVVRTVCYELEVDARFGYSTQPRPNCPGTDPDRSMFAAGTEVTVAAEQHGSWHWRGWAELDDDTNPAVVVLDGDTTLSARFEEKSTGEKIVDRFEDAGNALAVAAKKAAGVLTYSIVVFSEIVIKSTVLQLMSLGGDLLKAGFNALGIDGKVLDGAVYALKLPQNMLDGATGGLQCFTEWSLGTKIPTMGDLQNLDTTMLTSVAGDRATATLGGSDMETIVGAAREYADRFLAGDESAMTDVLITAGSGPGGAMTYRIFEDIIDNPQAWALSVQQAAEKAGEMLVEQWGGGFAWEGSARDAWTSGGRELGECLAGQGRSMLGV